MTNEQLIKNLHTPFGKADVVLDTDAYNEIDDQFAISYMLKSSDKLNLLRIYAAPFFNEKSKWRSQKKTSLNSCPFSLCQI